MPEQSIVSGKRLLDPVDRVSEVIFGLIMALTFTCTLSVAEAGRAEVRTMIIGALGCNLAWGLVDGFMFLIASFVERARGIVTLSAVRAAPDPKEANRIILDALPPLAAAAMKPEHVDDLRIQISGHAEVPPRARLMKNDWLGAIGICVLCFASTFPVVLPFMLVRDPATAVRVSNVVALVMLFAGGLILGRYAALKPWLMGAAMALWGSVLVAVTIMLGG